MSSTTVGRRSELNGSVSDTSAPFLVTDSVHTTCLPLKQEDYPLIKFWNKREWQDVLSKKKDVAVIAQAGAQQSATEDNVGLPYVEDSEGRAVSRQRVADIKRHAREIFTHFATRNPAAVFLTCGAFDVVSANYYRQEMARFAPELRLCEGDWKANRIATDNYPAWYRTYLRKRAAAAAEQTKLEDVDDVTMQPNTAATTAVAVRGHSRKRSCTSSEIATAKKVKQLSVTPELPGTPPPVSALEPGSLSLASPLENLAFQGHSKSEMDVDFEEHSVSLSKAGDSTLEVLDTPEHDAGTGAPSQPVGQAPVAGMVC